MASFRRKTLAKRSEKTQWKLTISEVRYWYLDLVLKLFELFDILFRRWLNVCSMYYIQLKGVNDWYLRWEKDEHLSLNNKQFTYTLVEKRMKKAARGRSQFLSSPSLMFRFLFLFLKKRRFYFIVSTTRIIYIESFICGNAD